MLVAVRNDNVFRYRDRTRVFRTPQEPPVKRITALVSTLSIVVAVAGLVAPSVLARPQTTSPGYNFNIAVTISKGGQCVMTRTLAKRGWLAHFVITNKDTKPHRFDVGGRHPARPIAPHATVKLGAYLADRGQYPFRVDGKVRGYFVVN
jgi:hypothetical protein